MSSVQPKASILAQGLWAGAYGGAIAGLGDSALSWVAFAQFAPAATTRLRAVFHVASLYALAGAALGVLVVAAVYGFMNYTRAGAMAAHLLGAHQQLRSRDPRRALGPLALALAAVPALAGALWLAYSFGFATLVKRHHKGLIVAVIIVATLALLGAAVVLSFVLGRLLEAALQKICRGRIARLLSHPMAAAVVPLVLLLTAAAIVAFQARETLAMLKLRPYWAVGGIAIAAVFGWFGLRRKMTRLAKRRRSIRIGLHLVLVGGCIAIALATGASSAVRKAAYAYTGLARPLALGMRRLAKLDEPSALLSEGATAGGQAGTRSIDGSLVVNMRVENAGFVPVPKAVPRDANVIMITVEALGAKHVSAYGYPRKTTPSIDALAGEGTLFLNAWSHAPSTRYAMPALLTGRYPSLVLWDTTIWWPALQPENETLAEIMKTQGVRTGAVLSDTYYEKRRRTDQGFDHYDNSNAKLHVGRHRIKSRGTSSRQQADGALRFIDRHAGQRFFLWVHFYDPHFEYESHEGTPSFGDRQVDLYDHEILFTDGHIARVIDRVKELGLYERTIFVLTGDHGEGFGEHGIYKHGYHLYAQLLKVPLIFRVPGLAPRRVSTPVQHVDIVPTLANLVGAGPNQAMNGRSLVGEIAGSAPADADRLVFQEVQYEGPTERRAVASKCWQLIYNMLPDKTYELYNMCQDPEQTRDLIEQNKAEAATLAAGLRAWIEQCRQKPVGSDARAKGLLSAPPKPELAVTARFGSAIKLGGVDLSARQVVPGKSLSLGWYFECLQPLTDDWRVFVHVERQDGSRLHGDHDPVHGALPTSQWQQGQWIVDRHQIFVPADTTPGKYTIYMGLYRGNRRMPVQGAGEHDGSEDRVRVATIDVLATP